MLGAVLKVLSMNCLRRQVRLSAALALAAGMISIPWGSANPAETSLRDIELQANGDEITLKVAGVARRDVIARIVPGRDVAIDWLDDALAEEPINGEYRGQIEQVLTELLDRSNFIIAYKKNGETWQISRILIAGPVSARISVGQMDRPIQTVNGASPRPKSARQRRIHRMQEKADSIGIRKRPLQSVNEASG